MRLIDADTLEWFQVTLSNKETCILIRKSHINELPTVDAEPVRHGEWMVQKVDANQTKFYCSKCERTILCGNDYFMKPSEYVANIYPYCHCGAKMHKGVQNDQN